MKIWKYGIRFFLFGIKFWISRDPLSLYYYSNSRNAWVVARTGEELPAWLTCLFGE